MKTFLFLLFAIIRYIREFLIRNFVGVSYTFIFTEIKHFNYYLTNFRSSWKLPFTMEVINCQ